MPPCARTALGYGDIGAAYAVASRLSGGPTGENLRKAVSTWKGLRAGGWPAVARALGVSVKKVVTGVESLTARRTGTRFALLRRGDHATPEEGEVGFHRFLHGRGEHPREAGPFMKPMMARGLEGPRSKIHVSGGRPVSYCGLLWAESVMTVPELPSIQDVATVHLGPQDEVPGSISIPMACSDCRVETWPTSAYTDGSTARRVIHRVLPAEVPDHGRRHLPAEGTGTARTVW